MLKLQHKEGPKTDGQINLKDSMEALGLNNACVAKKLKGSK